MKGGLIILAFIAILSVCHSQNTGKGFNPQIMNGRNSPQLQLQYCYIKNCREIYDNCNQDEKCIKLLRQCPPRSYQVFTECIQLVMNENREIYGLASFFYCIQNNCESSQTNTNATGESNNNGEGDD